MSAFGKSTGLALMLIALWGCSETPPEAVPTEAPPSGQPWFDEIGARPPVKAGMEAARSRGKRFGRPVTPPYVVARIEEMARTTDMSIRHIHGKFANRVSRSRVGQIVKNVRNPS